MRTIIPAAVVLAFAMPAQADPGAIPKLDIARLPAPCGAYLLHGARDPALVRAADVSIAMCLADVHVRAVTIVDTPETRDKLDAATRPSLQILDEVIGHGSPSEQILAEHARGDILGGLAVRLRNAVPSSGVATRDDQIARDERRAVVEDLVRPWLGAADASFDAALAVGRAHPTVSADPVIAATLSRCEHALYPTQTARR